MALASTELCPPEVRILSIVGEGTVQMVVIGADTHKRSHTVAAVDEGTGQLLDELRISADEAGHRSALRWARAIGQDRVWAIEDCRHVSRRFEQELLAAGERVIRVPPKMMGQSRRGEREWGKSDEIDARSVARAVVKEGVERFPAASLDERALEIRLLTDHRDNLVRERTRLQNRLRWHLLDLCPDLEAKLAPRSLTFTAVLERIARRLRRLPSTATVRIARELVADIKALVRRASELERELRQLVREYNPALLAEAGCGTITAATMIGRTGGAQRFATDARFARQAGTAPVKRSSGNTNRHRLHLGGDRQLNRSLHMIALTRSRCDPETRAYLDRKRSEGKTNREAMRCLKRHLARRFHRLLSQSTTTTTPPPSLAPALEPMQLSTAIAGAAPALMPCART